MKRATRKAVHPPRRSPCPISCSLDLLGDKWTLLIIRDLFLGRSRFRDFASSPESIASNILTDRLKRLLDAQVIRADDAPDRQAACTYTLTPKGLALRPVLEAMLHWGTQHIPGSQALLQPTTTTPPTAPAAPTAPNAPTAHPRTRQKQRRPSSSPGRRLHS